jgi:hypothetical protein
VQALYALASPDMSAEIRVSSNDANNIAKHLDDVARALQ